jgi:hypothetical protein
MMQLKPGDVGTSKRGIGTFVSSQATDGLGIRTLCIRLTEQSNDVQFH